jgi:predicted  nucleic acid-binding Zn ribbon protein
MSEHLDQNKRRLFSVVSNGSARHAHRCPDCRREWKHNDPTCDAPADEQCRACFATEQDYYFHGDDDEPAAA